MIKWAFAVFCLLWHGTVPAATTPETGPMPKQVTLGSVAMDIPTEMIRRMNALARHIGTAAHLRIDFRPSPNLDTAVDDLGAGLTQIAYLTPVAYIEAQRKYGAEPLVAPTTHGRPSFALVIAVKAGSGIGEPAGLKGKRFAFGDEKALLQKAAVESMGLKTSDFSDFAYLRHYDNIAKAVLAGDFDGGILKDSVADDFRDRGIVVIGSTPPLPSYVFAVRPDMPAALRDRLREAFLALDRNQPGGAAVLNAFDGTCDGFVVVEDKAYDTVRKLILPHQK